MAAASAVEIVRSFMTAFHEQDRARAESLMADAFVFTSPQDDHIDKQAWLERCFPSADHFDGASETLEMVEVDGIVLHRYEYQVEGVRWRNTEALRVEDGRVREVEVYFGGAVDPRP
ncbi:nuclear transport factor 2 family protein [Microbacterium terricola]|uniref:DUF4440 domain-containing protein n=1 Tax=Microbacterium terricola TaxID=344163 RepID=A0ABM8E026_9MICO|nr:nuclear transport factor 2 family protein [Microbacterium terricola]UYK40971.1 nuclear transport factor 2 family protein [Microbacterium terricola]BDV31273.1 hypothetical protein Microterr_19330 [Microbacterium terricola]